MEKGESKTGLIRCLWGAGIALSFIAGYQLPNISGYGTDPSSKTNTANQEQLMASELSQRGASDRTREIALICEKAIQDGAFDDVEELLRLLESLHPDDRAHLIETLAANVHNDPEKFAALAQKLTLAIYRKDPRAGADFIFGFPRAMQILKVERYLLSDWVSKDPEAVRQMMIDRLRNDQVDSSTQIEQLSSIYAHEHQEKMSEWVDWLGSLDRKEDWDVYRSGFESVARHANADQREMVLEDLLGRVTESEGLWNFPAMVIGQQAVDDPERAREMLVGIPTGPWKDLALRRFLTETGARHPEIGVDLMSQPNFMDEFSEKWDFEDNEVVVSENEIQSEADHEKFFDTALGFLLEAAIDKAPEVVVASADSFYDPELKEVFVKAAKERLSGEIFQGQFGEDAHQCGPHCKH